MRNSSRLQSGASLSKVLLIVLGLVMFALGVTVFANTTPTILEGIDFNLGKTFANFGIFLILFPLIWMLFGKPLQQAIDERNSELEKTFSDAEQLRARMDTMKSEYEQRLAASEAEARERIRAQVAEAQQLKQHLMAEASKRADDLVRKAQEEIAMEKERALSDIRLNVVNLTLNATERILGANVDDERNRRLIDEFISKAEVPA